MIFKEYKKSNENKLTRDFSTEDVNVIYDMYKEMNPQRSIASHLKTRGSNISYILKDLGFKKRYTGDYYTSDDLGNRKYSYDDTYFEEIDTEDKAYWLGFLYADGNVRFHKGFDGGTKGGAMSVALKREDRYHLERFKRCLKSEHKIEDTIVKLNGNEYEASRFQLYSIKMCNDLVKHGCIPNKSLTLKYPNTVPDCLMKDFLRGYFDGDGSISFNITPKTDSLSLTMMGTLEFLESAREVFESNGVEVKSLRKTLSEAYEIGIYGRENIALFYNYIYYGSTIFLERKFQKLREALYYFDIDFKISEVAKRAFLMDDNMTNLKEYRDKYRKRIDNVEYGWRLMNFMGLKVPQKSMSGKIDSILY